MNKIKNKILSEFKQKYTRKMSNGEEVILCRDGTYVKLVVLDKLLDKLKRQVYECMDGGNKEDIIPFKNTNLNIDEINGYNIAKIIFKYYLDQLFGKVKDHDRYNKM